MTARVVLDRRDPELDRLLKQPEAFGFFEVVRFLSERWPDAPSPGGRGPYSKERIRFVQDPSMGFPAGDLRDVSKDALVPYERFVVQATFLGLSGAGTPLPASLVSELCIPDESLDSERAYLDWIHHRLYGLLYQASHRLSEIRQLPKASERRVTHPQLELLAPSLGQGGSSGAQDFQQFDLLDIAPVIAQGNASLEVVEMAVARVLAPYLGSNSRIELCPMTGAWAQLQAQDRWSLGAQSILLGEHTMLGDQAWVRSLGVTLRIYGLPWEIYQSLWVQGQAPLLRLRALCELLIAEPLIWTLDVEVVELPVHGWTLGQDALGASSWLLSPECETISERRTLTEHLERRQSETGR